MLSFNMVKALNEQIAREALASAQYLAMASWLSDKGFEGAASFLYAQSDEERMHMLKIFHYINDSGNVAIAPGVKLPVHEFDSFRQVFELILEQEQEVTRSIHELVNLSYEERDHTTNNFLQWYVAEQLEEENQIRTILDKLKIIGNDGGAMYMLDKDLKGLIAVAQPKAAK